MSDGTTVIVAGGEQPSPPPVVVTGAETVVTPETGEEAATIETVADSAVQIAQIEADTTVTLAAINAETETARIEAENERDVRWHEQRTNTLELELATLRERAEAAETALALLTPQPSLEPAPVVVETPEGMTVTLETPAETSSEIETEALERSEAERLAAEAQPVRRRHRMI